MAQRENVQASQLRNRMVTSALSGAAGHLPPGSPESARPRFFASGLYQTWTSSRALPLSGQASATGRVGSTCVAVRVDVNASRFFGDVQIFANKTTGGKRPELGRLAGFRMYVAFMPTPGCAWAVMSLAYFPVPLSFAFVFLFPFLLFFFHCRIGMSLPIGCIAIFETRQKMCCQIVNGSQSNG